MKHVRPRASEIIAVLAEWFPACIVVFEGRRRPLAVGIRNDLIAQLDGAATALEITAALRRYCSSFGYLKNCVVGAERVDLDGNPVGVINEQEAAHAAGKLAELRAARKAKSPTKATTPAAQMMSATRGGQATVTPTKPMATVKPLPPVASRISVTPSKRGATARSIVVVTKKRRSMPGGA